MNKKTIILVLIFSLFLTISHVSALDANDTLIMEENNDGSDLSNPYSSQSDYSISADADSQSENILKENGYSSFKDLESLINDCENNLTLENDFKFNPETDSDLVNGIVINKPLSIEGNNHTIDADNLSRIFNFTDNSILTLNNINLINGFSSNRGGAIYSSGQVALSNSSVNNNFAEQGGAIYSMDDVIASNCTFIGNEANITANSLNYGGAIYSSKAVFAYDSLFENCSSNQGGAISADGYVNTYGSTYRNNYAVYPFSNNGGAIYAKSMLVDSCIFESNTARVGGAIRGDAITVMNSNFTSNSATHHGGAVYARNLTAINCSFENNSAKFGGAVLTIYNSYIGDSVFINNSVGNGGGAISSTARNNTVFNSTFIDNSALSYGGAIISDYVDVINSTFINNTALAYGGAMLVGNASLSNNVFNGNDANNGTDLFAIGNYNLDGVLSDESTSEFHTLNLDDSLPLEYHGDIFYSNGARGFCSEERAFTPSNAYIIDDFISMRNSITGEEVSEYAKILIYEYYFNQSVFEPYSMFQFIWALTDGNITRYGEIYPPIQHVIDLYDSGFRVPTNNASRLLENGTIATFNFRYGILPDHHQNTIYFNITYEEINETVSKETLDEIVTIGDTVRFRINLTNNGQEDIVNPYVIDEDYSNGLVYISWEAENGNWTKENNKYVLNEVLSPGDSRTLIIIFNTTSGGVLINNASSGYNNLNISNATNKTFVNDPDMTIIKISNNKTVEVGEIVSFTIVLTNTGNCNLSDVYIRDNEYSEGLEYLSYVDKDGIWTFDGVDTWTYKGILEPGQSIRLDILFNATTVGLKVNTAVAGHNWTNETVNSTNTTNVTNKTNPPGNETTPPGDNETVPPIEDPKVPKEVKKIASSNLKTGNPLLILLISMILLVPFRNRNKK